MTKTARSYILCSTPRCGSTMLCEMLWQTGAAGRPNSFYREQSIGYWADKWKVPYPDGLHTPSFDRAYLAAMVREGNAGTGVFGIRIMWPSMADASTRLGRALGSDLDISEKFEEAFGEPRYIHVSRVDKVAQAVSRLRAEQSGIWYLGADGSVQVAGQS